MTCVGIAAAAAILAAAYLQARGQDADLVWVLALLLSIGSCAQ